MCMKKANKRKSKGMKRARLKAMVTIIITIFFLVGLVNVLYGGRESFVEGKPTNGELSVDDLVITDIVGWWHFDEGSGNTAYDSSSYSNDGTCSGTQWVLGHDGHALSFRADSSSNVNVADDPSLDFDDLEENEGFMIDFWMKQNQTPNPPHSAGLVVKHYEGGYGVYMRPNYHIAFAISPPGITHTSKNLLSKEPISDNKWHRIVAVWDGSTMYLYIDDLDMPDNSTSLGDFTIGDTGKSLEIGNNWAGDKKGDYTGLIDEVQISTIETGLVGQWHFDEGSGNIAYDNSGYGNDGTIHGAKWTIGVSGKALSFDGSNDYVTVQDHPSLNFNGTNQFTLETWVKWDGTTNPGHEIGIIDKEYAKTGFYLVMYGDLLRFRVGDGNNSYLLHSNIEMDTEWHHVVGVWDGSTQYLYIDGVLDNSSYRGSIKVKDYPKLLEFGNRWGYTDDINTFRGVLDEIRIYDYALNVNEILEHYDENKPNVPPTVDITSPSNDVTVSGITTVMGTASDSDGTVQKVQVKIDSGSWYTATGTTSWSYAWDTTKVSNAYHTISARSYDGTDYSGTFSVGVTVNNYVPPQKPDLYLNDYDISFSEQNPSVGDNVTIYAVIHNKGEKDAVATVKFYDGDPEASDNPSEILIGTDSVSVVKYGTDTAFTTWTAISEGNHTIYVVVSDCQPPEETENNNIASNTLSVALPVSPILRITLGQFDVVTIKENKDRDIPIRIYCYGEPVKNVYIQILEDSNLTVIPITPDMDLDPWEQRDYLINIRVPKLDENVTVGSKTILVQAVGDDGVMSNTENITVIISEANGIPSFTTLLTVASAGLGALVAFFRRRYRNGKI